MEDSRAGGLEGRKDAKHQGGYSEDRGNRGQEDSRA